VGVLCCVGGCLKPCLQWMGVGWVGRWGGVWNCGGEVYWWLRGGGAAMLLHCMCMLLVLLLLPHSRYIRAWMLAAAKGRGGGRSGVWLLVRVLPVLLLLHAMLLLLAGAGSLG